jgi:hypothetical protein
MAKLEAVLDANISPFQKALDKAAEKAREFGESTADVGKDLFRSLSGLDLSKLLGIGAATYAATKFGEALVDAAKEGYRAFSEYQEAVLRFKFTLPTRPGEGAFAAGRAAETAEIARGGIFPEKEMQAAALALLQASEELRKSPEKLAAMMETFKSLAIKTGGSPAEIAESYRRLVVGIKEEGSAAVGKFFKATPGLEEQTEALRDAHAQAYLHAQGLRDSSEANTQQLSEYRRLQREPISEFMTEESKRIGATKVLEEIKEILERSAPKAVAAEAIEAHPEKMLAAAWQEASQAFGKELKPAIDDFVKMIMDHMPAITEAMSGFGTGLKIAIEGVIPPLKFLADVIEGLGRVVAYVLNKIGGLIGAPVGVTEKAETTSRMVDQRIDTEKKIREEQDKASEEAKDAAKEKAAIEDEANKAAVKSAEEVALIGAKAAASHEESQRRIAFEAAQADLRNQAQAAARRAVIDRPRGMTEELDKEYAIEADSTAKIINIKAEAAARASAAEEEAANRIAKIDEEATARNIERERASAMDEGAERSAILAKLNAEDDAAGVAREDAIAESREKIREADVDAANKIIDAQEEAASRIINEQEAAALRTLAKMKGPYEAKIEEEPARFPTFGKWIKGEYHESEYERKEREKRNSAAQAEADAKNREWKELQAVGIKHEFEEKKRVVEDALEAQRPTQISLKQTHQIQQQEHVKAIEAEKTRTEADQEFAKAHKELELPPEPGEEPKGKADVSRKTVAEILVKIFDQDKDWKKEWEKVFQEE